MIRFKCRTCGKTVSGRTELDAELAFESHKCTVDYKSMSPEQLIDSMIASGHFKPEEREEQIAKLKWR